MTHDRINAIMARTERLADAERTIERLRVQLARTEAARSRGLALAAYYRTVEPLRNVADQMCGALALDPVHVGESVVAALMQLRNGEQVR